MTEKIPGRYRLVVIFFLIMTAASFITRIVLCVKSLPAMELSLPLLAKIFGVGLFFDVVAFSYALIPFAILIVVIPDRVHNWRISRIFSQIFFFIFTFAMLFNGVSEYIFFDEFATRYNFIAVDYLIYTTEVIRNIRESYPVGLIITSLTVITVIPFIPISRAVSRTFPSNAPLRKRAAISGSILLLPIASFFFVDLAMTEISPNNYANELAGNGLYGFASAFRNNELDFNKFYAAKDDNLVMNHLRTLLVSPDKHGIAREIHGKGAMKRHNVILVCVESLSAEYMTAFGNNKGITPNLDRLAKESLFFTHLYASGTRTVRGLEAITLSIPPLPGTAIVKRPGNENLFSIGAVMKNHGYDNHFIYGGRGYFDNMNYFFANNGFKDIDQTDMTKEEVTFKNAWGVCDEDLFDKTIKQADISFAQKQPFFSFVMTTSNHRPYTYPEGKIDIPSGSGRDGAVKYTDYALNQLIEKSKMKPWFKETIFIIVADHCAGSARKLALPIKNYEIPMLIYAPNIVKPKIVDKMMAQIDIAPTLLGLLNISYSSSFFGRDIFDKNINNERAFIGTYQKLGYIDGNRLLTLDPGKKVEQYSFTRADGNTTPIPADDRLLMNGLAYYQGSAYTYKQKLGRVAQ
ncbi:MAG: sulfatase-like hydrolase/transferase [Geobacteraceae bacterium]|nr:sulfatase-like hydrolase/transferase [Geobacteraceae bacterium]